MGMRTRVAVSRSGGIGRLLGYHGAEHKVVAALETCGRPPTIEEARAASPLHPRCGTSLHFWFVVAAGVVHAFLPRDPLWAAAGWRLLVLPVDLALAYEIMRATARLRPGPAARVAWLPGRALQRLTTREPGPDELEVALAALRGAVG